MVRTNFWSRFPLKCCRQAAKANASGSITAAIGAKVETLPLRKN